MRKIDMTKGNIIKSLFTLALPIMGTSFMQMAYNMTDLIWIGKTGSKAVAAVGTAGFFMWFGFAFIMYTKLGAEIGVAQTVGAGDHEGTRKFVDGTIKINIFLGAMYAAILVIFREQMIGFFNIEDKEVVSMGITYLRIVALFANINFIIPLFTGIYNGLGDSKKPFLFNGVGLIVNIILDPLLILGIGPFPQMGVAGAAIATVFSQVVVFIVFMINLRNHKDLFKGFKIFKMPDFEYVKKINKIGFPPGIQSALFTLIAMVIARIIASFGEIPIAVQKVGSQIEAISWMSASGFSTALGAFTGQNYGAKKYDRVREGFKKAMSLMGVFGLFTSAVLIIFAEPLFAIFINEPEAIKVGTGYLKILGLSQLFMCIEITTAGAFNGIAKTSPPSIVSISFNILRIPLAMYLAFGTSLGLEGIWWAITISSTLKGIVLFSWYILYVRKFPDFGKDLSRETA